VNLEARLLVMWFLRDREPQRALVLWGSMAARATQARITAIRSLDTSRIVT
jgi:hypothetical protein